MICGEAITFGGGSGNELIVTAPAGSTVTATKDGKTKRATEKNGVWTFKGLEAGEWTVTATQGSSIKTEVVMVSAETLELNFNAVAVTAPTAGITYTDGISGLSAENLNEISKAISNNSAITSATSVVYIDWGWNSRKISVGDSINWKIGSVSYQFDVIGFNHDALVNTAAYGAKTATGKAGIAFQMHDCYATKYAIHTQNFNSCGWHNSAMRNTHLPTLRTSLPEDVQAAIKTITKQTTQGSASTTLKTTEDTLFLLSEKEVWGTLAASNRQAAAEEGTQYAYYAAGNSKQKTLNGSRASWLTRSPAKSDYNNWVAVSYYGSGEPLSQQTSTANANPVAFGFCL